MGAHPAVRVPAVIAEGARIDLGALDVGLSLPRPLLVTEATTPLGFLPRLRRTAGIGARTARRRDVHSRMSRASIRGAKILARAR
ncbi:hypothetical protein [Gordonia sp. (in: high G+C Gram-positive bacteria)]|uniref:hypothetical protein n=1 Tax=Gordonia sp. (in: high G+C Gram-positive bacteria) TaxID=84139 RepID=UPI00333F0C4B